MTDTVSILAEAFEDHQRGAAAPGTSLFEFMAKRLAAASPQGEGDCVCVQRGDGPEGCGLCNETGIVAPVAMWNRRTPIKPSGDTGELRKRVAQIIGEAVNRRAPGQIVFSTLEDADAILDLIQSEKAG